MATTPPITGTLPAIEQELVSVYSLYSVLAPSLDPGSGLGGALLYAGELTPDASHLIRAANIAGAASLAASADPVQLRQAMHTGVIDFLVTSLDEALRILKNEIRKRQPVAVAISASPGSIAKEMLDCGVQPDLLAPELPRSNALDEFLKLGARSIRPMPLSPDKPLQIFPVPPAWPGGAAAFEVLLLEEVPPNDHATRRWLRLSPRYLDPQARRLRSLACTKETASKLSNRINPPQN